MQFVVNGPCVLRGNVSVQGSKNSVLPILAACLLTKDVVFLENCPHISDLQTAIEILKTLGCRVEAEGHRLMIDSSGKVSTCIPKELCGGMRSSLTFLGALLGREGEASFFSPGGCDIGKRPIDFHLAAFEKLGFAAKGSEPLSIAAAAPHKGAKIRFPYPSVGATENAILAAVTAKGKTVIKNAAREPEIRDLAEFLNRCGADIKGAGEGIIIVNGVKRLHGCRYHLPDDRIAAATYLAAAAATGGELTLRISDPGRIQELFPFFREAGCVITSAPEGVFLEAPERLLAIGRIETAPYPGFSTDMQPLFMAMMLKAEGTSFFSETVFEDRFAHAKELRKIGGDIAVSDRVALVRGKEKLFGSRVTAPDLRGGAALLIAALAAEGETIIDGVEHIDRGYENIEDLLCRLGGQVIRR